jgi:hypothetical protein
VPHVTLVVENRRSHLFVTLEDHETAAFLTKAAENAPEGSTLHALGAAPVATGASDTETSREPRPRRRPTRDQPLAGD